MKINKEKIQELVKILDELSLTELSYSDGKESIKVGKGAKATVGFAPQANQTSSKTKSYGAFKA